MKECWHGHDGWIFTVFMTIDHDSVNMNHDSVNITKIYNKETYLKKKRKNSYYF